MPSVFEEHRAIVAQKTIEYQEVLSVRIAKFEQDLQLYWKQCDEIQYWGNIDEIFRYRKKATSLENRLIVGMDRIERFNEEEQLYGWELSQYPLRKKVLRLIHFIHSNRDPVLSSSTFSSDCRQTGALQKTLRRSMRVSY